MFSRQHHVLETIEQVAPSNATVLIHGETGTGKTTTARQIHRLSPRADKQFIVFDSAAVAPSLIESALFGHEKGAFTGATDARVGALEAAMDGTLFIDEITELSLDLQPKLLRALEERVFSRVGSNKVVPFSARVLAASQFDLRERVRSGTFRQDLYFRLAVVTIDLLPLRARGSEIPGLINQMFQEQHASALRFETLPEKLQKSISQYDWPGNIRELRNVVERLTVMNADDVRIASFGRTNNASSDTDETLFDYEQPFHAFKESLLGVFERRYVEHLLKRSDNNVTRAAQSARMNRRYLYVLMEKYGLR